MVRSEIVFLYNLPLKLKLSSFESHLYKEMRSLFQITVTTCHVHKLIYTFSYCLWIIHCLSFSLCGSESNDVGWFFIYLFNLIVFVQEVIWIHQ